MNDEDEVEEVEEQNAGRTYDILLGILIVLAILVSCATMYYLYTLFRPGGGTGILPRPPVVEDDPTWERIRTSGKIVVGTSADYPPFAYYNTNFQLDGFDIALMREIGQGLGLQIEFRDMVFDGLGDALQIGQIDAAIGGISVTPARQAVVGFSNIYFVSNDAILARADSTIGAITSPDQLAPFRVGVQRGSVFQNWIQTTLVDTNKMPAGNLLVYQKAEHAVRDLRDSRVDLVVLDMPVAEVEIGNGGVKLVGQGLNPQAFAIALPFSSPTLKAEIDRMLAQLQANGRLSALIQQFLNLPPGQIVPPPTPHPNPSPVPTAPPVACTNGMQFVQDLNYDDHNMTAPPVLQPGQTFQKGWRIRNTGTCTWNASFTLRYLSGNTPAAQMGGQPTAVVGTVAPGQTYDIYVTLVAPITPGTFQGFWGMHDGSNRQFGDRIWVGIRVPPPPTATPLPTQTPSPTMNFTVNRNQIFAGECVTFSWTVTGSSATFFYPQGQPWQQFPVPPQSTRQECPPVTTTYELRAVRQDASVEVRQITVFVNAAPGAPVIDRFTLDPPYQINTGGCVAVSWSVSGNVTSVRILRNGAGLWDPAPVSGTQQDCPPGPGTVTYTIEASGPGGTSRLQSNLNVVNPPPQATATPTTPAVNPPVIYNFAVFPNAIQVGQCVTISWSAGGGALSTRLLRNGATILDNGPLGGTEQDCPVQAGTVTYRLEARSASDTVGQDTAVTVQNAPPVQSPLAGTNWDLVAYNNGTQAMVSLISGTTITAEFGADSVSLTGSAGCNTYNGNYTTQGPSIAIRGIAASQQTCPTPDGIMAQESRYLSLLATAVTFQINGDQLEMFDANGGRILQFQRLTSQPR